MTYNQLLTYINARIKPNDNREISAAKHREVLYALLDYINAGDDNSDSAIDTDDFVTKSTPETITAAKLFTALDALKIGTATGHLTFNASNLANHIGRILMGNISADRAWSLPDDTGTFALTKQLIEFSITETEILWRNITETEWQVFLDFSVFLTEETDPIAMAAIGNREYTEENHITSGDTITKSVDDLDKAIEDFTGNTEELPTIELPTEELPSQQIIFDSEEIPEVGRQIIIEVSEDSTTYTWKLDETKVDHNNLLNFEDDRHRKMNYDEELKAYLIEN